MNAKLNAIFYKFNDWNEYRGLEELPKPSQHEMLAYTQAYKHLRPKAGRNPSMFPSLDIYVRKSNTYREEDAKHSVYASTQHP